MGAGSWVLPPASWVLGTGPGPGPGPGPGRGPGRNLGLVPCPGRLLRCATCSGVAVGGARRRRRKKPTLPGDPRAHPARDRGPASPVDGGGPGFSGSLASTQGLRDTIDLFSVDFGAVFVATDCCVSSAADEGSFASPMTDTFNIGLWRALVPPLVFGPGPLCCVQLPGSKSSAERRRVLGSETPLAL